MKQIFLYASLISLFFIGNRAIAQCSGSLSVSATTVTPGTTVNASATGWMDDYEWYAEGGTSSQVTWNGNSSWSTTFNTPGVYELCTAMWCDDWGGQVVQVECATITVTNPDGTPPANANHCNSPEPAPADLIGDAPLVCSFDDYCATTINYCGPDASCSPDDNINPENIGSWTIENNSWIKFIAASSTACFDIDITCIPSSGVGIQWAIVSWNGSGGTGGFTEMGGENSSTTSLTGYIQACGTGLTVGNTYYLTIDGHSGSLCNYTINADNGVNFPPPDPVIALADGQNPLNLCDIPPSVLLTATGGDGVNYTWTLADGTPLGTGSSIVQGIPANTAPGTVYNVVVESPSPGGGCNPAAGTPITGTVDVIFCTTLPVEVEDFDLTCVNNGIEVNWTSLSEINNDYYIIERKIGEGEFEFIAMIDGVGNSTSSIYYSYVDNSRIQENLYYRLSQVDFDGKRTNIGVKYIQCGNGNFVYPNPFNDQISINVNDFFNGEEGTIEIINSIGQRIAIYDATGFNSVLNIDAANFSKGVYVIVLTSTSDRFVQRVVK